MATGGEDFDKYEGGSLLKSPFGYNDSGIGDRLAEFLQVRVHINPLLNSKLMGWEDGTG